MSENKLVPKLRFSGFEDEWDEKPLSKFTSVNPKSSKLPDEFIYIDLESVNKGLLTEIKTINKNEAPSRAQRLLESEDILFQTVRPYQRNNYYFNNNDGDYVASTGYAQFRTDNSSKFLYHFLHTDKFVNKVLAMCTGTSYPAINTNDLKKINIQFPTLSEQNKIADFFLNSMIKFLYSKINYLILKILRSI